MVASAPESAAKTQAMRNASLGMFNRQRHLTARILDSCIQATSKPSSHDAGVGTRLSYGCGSKPFWSHFGAGAPPILVYFSGDWDVHWGYGILTHGHMNDFGKH